jgi:lysophospholipase L1-like esterase
MRALAEEAGFEILDMADAYEGRDPRTLWLGEWDQHLNAEGHRLMAERLYEALAANERFASRTRNERGAGVPPAERGGAPRNGG